MVTILIIFLFMIVAAFILREEREEQQRVKIQNHYIEMLLVGTSQSERYIEEISHLSGGVVRSAVAEVVAGITPIIYRIDSQALENISHSFHLSEFMLRKSRESYGVERVCYLSIFSRIPPSDIRAEQMVSYLQSKDRMVRFFAMLITINLDRGMTLHHISQYKDILTSFELSQLLSLLQQGVIAVAYQPLLDSDNLNLNLLGVAVVQHFGIESAHGDLRDIVDKRGGYSYLLRRDALYALASMQLMLATPSVAQFVRGMPRLDRVRFLRYIAIEGYSQSVVDLLSSTHERSPLDALIESYKIKIGCYS